MYGIFKKDNVYVYVYDEEIRNDIKINDIDSLVYSPNSNKRVFLYGGRVHIKIDTYHSVKLCVDGIPIQLIEYSDNLLLSLSDEIAITMATAFLNQMENLGVDTFLDNYKKQLVSFKKEMEEKVEKMEEEQSVHFDEEKASSISNLKRALLKLAYVIFSLLINMNAGLDNQTYSDAYNEIMNLYF